MQGFDERQLIWVSGKGGMGKTTCLVRTSAAVDAAASCRTGLDRFCGIGGWDSDLV